MVILYEIIDWISKTVSIRNGGGRSDREEYVRNWGAVASVHEHTTKEWGKIIAILARTH